MQKCEPAPQRKTLDPKLDIVFWMLFGAEQNRDLLISLLNAVLSPPVPIASLEVLPRNDEQSLTLWGKFLSAQADEELEQLAMESPVLKQAKAALDRLSADDISRMQAEQRDMALRAHEAGMAAAREEAEQKGLEKGLQKGRQEGRIEERTHLLVRLLTLKFGVQPASTAERLAHASDAELSRWLDQALTVDTFEEVFF